MRPLPCRQQRPQALEPCLAIGRQPFHRGATGQVGLDHVQERVQHVVRTGDESGRRLQLRQYLHREVAHRGRVGGGVVRAGHEQIHRVGMQRLGLPAHPSECGARARAGTRGRTCEGRGSWPTASRCMHRPRRARRDSCRPRRRTPAVPQAAATARRSPAGRCSRGDAPRRTARSWSSCGRHRPLAARARVPPVSPRARRRSRPVPAAGWPATDRTGRSPACRARTR